MLSRLSETMDSYPTACEEIKVTTLETPPSLPWLPGQETACAGVQARVLTHLRTYRHVCPHIRARCAAMSFSGCCQDVMRDNKENDFC